MQLKTNLSKHDLNRRAARWTPHGLQSTAILYSTQSSRLDGTTIPSFTPVYHYLL